MKKRLLLTLICLLLHLGIFAQKTIKIIVCEKGSDAPIIGAVILYDKTPQLASPSHQITDTNGEAKIRLKGKKTYYKISSIGYQTASGEIDASASPARLEISLRTKERNLANVVVTSSRAARPIRISPIITQVISAKSLTNAGYADIQQALRQETPGLNIQKVGFGNEISLQGLDARHVLFLMDGEPMTGEVAGNLDYERFNIHALDRIEIIKGSSSILYGNKSSGAVINLITKKTNNPIDLQVGLRYGQRNERNFPYISKHDLMYMYEKNADRPNLQSWISAGFHHKAFTSQTDIWYSSSDAYFIYEKENAGKLYPAGSNPFLKHDTIVHSSALHPPLGISGNEHISLSQKLYLDPTPDLGLQVYGSAFFMNTYDLIQNLNFSQARDLTSGGKISYKFKDYFTLSAGIHLDFYNRYKRHERIDYHEQVYQSRIIQPRFMIRSTYFKNHKLMFGMEYRSDDLTSDRFVPGKMVSRSLNETDWYAQDEWRYSSHWTFSLGLRTNWSLAYGLMFMPKVAVKYSPNKHWAIRSNYSLGYRSPSIKELFFNWDHLAMFKIKGNEFLLPERNDYLSLGVEYSNEHFFINADIYQNAFRDKIEGLWKIYDLQYNFEYHNIGKQHISGVEALMRWSPIKELTFNASYSFVHITKTQNRRFNSTSPHAATASLTYNLLRPKYHLQAILSTSFMGPKQFDVQDRLIYDGKSRPAYFRTKLPSYFLANLTISQTLFKKYKLTLGADNLFNYHPETIGSGVTLFNIAATPGRRIFFQLEFLLN